MNKVIYRQGFTLLEILLVVVILAIMTTVGVNLLNSQSVERLILNEAKKIEQNLVFLCEKAILDNQPIGIEINELGYQAFRYLNQSWQTVESDQIFIINDSIALTLWLDGIEQRLPAEPMGLPQIVCQSDGSFNAFEARLTSATDQTNATYYELVSVSPWELGAGWHEQ